MRLLIADDHDLVRETLAAFLVSEGLAQVATAASLPEALEAMRGAAFDLVLLDYAMPGMNGLEGLARAREVAAGRPVALISGTTARELAEAALRAGAAGFVPKTLGSGAIAAAIRHMAGGEVFAPIGLLTDGGDAIADLSALTRRELDVLRGLCQGRSNKEIARDLDLQEVTVKLHVKTLSRKLGARNRTHAAMIARNAGMA
jgi:two-component system, NarL family, nitrate/nitrite response regulator NarL